MVSRNPLAELSRTTGREDNVLHAEGDVPHSFQSILGKETFDSSDESESDEVDDDSASNSDPDWAPNSSCDYVSDSSPRQKKRKTGVSDSGPRQKKRKMGRALGPKRRLTVASHTPLVSEAGPSSVSMGVPTGQRGPRSCHL